MAEPDSFMSHLIELRDRLLRCVLALLLVFICLFPWARDLYALLAQPMIASMPAGGRLIATEVTAPFFVPVKVTMMAAFVIALPYLLYQIWAFVAPGLYDVLAVVGQENVGGGHAADSVAAYRARRIAMYLSTTAPFGQMRRQKCSICSGSAPCWRAVWMHLRASASCSSCK